MPHARWAAAWLPPLLLPLLAAAAPDAAVDAPAEQRELETVTVTATRREARSRDVAAAIGQVSMKEVLATAPDVIAEALRGQPGAFFQQTTPGQGTPIIRGLKGSQILHLVDGMRLNNAFFRSAPNQYLALVDAYAVERIEVVRGAAGALYGADAMGGVVQVLTREPATDADARRAGGRLFGAWSSADHGLALRADGELAGDGAGFVGGVTLQDYRDRRTARGTVRPSAYRAEAADAKAVFAVGAAGELMLSAQVAEQPSTPRTDELVPGFGQTTPASEQFRFAPNRRSFLHARYRWRGDSRAFTDLELHLARQVVTDDRVTQDFGAPLVSREHNESTLDGLTLQAGAAATEALRLTWGLEVYRDEVRSARRRGAPGEEGVPVASRFPDGSSMDSEAAYLAAAWTPAGRLALDAGLRFSRFDIHLPPTPVGPGARLSPDDVSGDLRAVWALSGTTRLVANLGRGFRPPNIFDLGTLGPRPGNRFNVANPDLGPETVWSYDLGIKSVSGAWEVEAFAFHLDYRDKITSVLTGEITPEGREVVRSENLAEVSLWGVEAGLRWQPAPGTRAYLTVNYTRGEERERAAAALPADRVPPLNGTLGVAFDLGEAFTLEPFLFFAAGQDRLSPRDASDPRIDPLGTPGWVTLNLAAGWRISASLRLDLLLENLGDKAYREHGSGIDAPGRNLGLRLTALF